MSLQAELKLSHDEYQIMLATALLWRTASFGRIHNVLSSLKIKNANGKAFVQRDMGTTLKNLCDRGLLINTFGDNFSIASSWANRCYQEVLDTYKTEQLKRTLFEIFGTSESYMHWYADRCFVPIMRLYILTNCDNQFVDQQFQRVESNGGELSDYIQRMFFIDFDEAIFDQVEPSLQQRLLIFALLDSLSLWLPNTPSLIQFALKKQASKPSFGGGILKSLVSEYALLQGKYDEVLKDFESMEAGFAYCFRAYVKTMQGQWAEAQVLFEQAFKLRQKEVGGKKGLFSDNLVWAYPLCLFAQGGAKQLELARKFCLQEAGKKTPDINTRWGQWAFIMDVKSGSLELSSNLLQNLNARVVGIGQFWRVLLLIWLGHHKLSGVSKNYQKEIATSIEHLQTKLKAIGFDALGQMLLSAQQMLFDLPPAPTFFVQAQMSAWQELLQELQQLNAPDQERKTVTSRLLWGLQLGRQGQLVSINCWEQKAGKKGWNKAQRISIAKALKLDSLSDHDNRILRHNKESAYGRELIFTRSAAITEMVGHPAVFLDDNPDQLFELVAATPEMDIEQKGEQISLKITPPFRSVEQDSKYYPEYDLDSRADRDTLRLITLEVDGNKIKYYRFTPEQRRTAQLLARPIKIPASAKQEVQQVMQSLSGHFQLFADKALDNATEVAWESRFRAELAPAGEGLSLRLVAAPLGEQGGRYVPAQGRARVTGEQDGKAVATTRKLKQEKQQLDNIIATLPFLDEFEVDEQDCYWEVSDPEQALEMVEILPTLSEISALDWPKGKAVRVHTVDKNQLNIQIKSERDWFAINGQAKLDEGLVFQFEGLLAAAMSKSRFVSMGDGVYLALTKRLREQLNDIASVAESQKSGTKVPKLAAAWLEKALENIPLKSDKEFKESIKKLKDSEEQNFPLPHGLQAELRPYQEDGFVWASRLAASGFGGCLADDMGLGKTLQSLAVLLSRAEGGPALIIAPTSVCGNWLSEANRFAPSLNVHLYSEAERENVINQAGPLDVLVVSYTLLVQAGEQFAAKHWHTVIADEAQAIKNATAKRTQAVFELNADFRLALSGTPVENRLAELWSIMRFANPGLLGSLTRFNERFVNPIERNKDRDALHTLRRLIAPFLLRRTKAQVLQELPPRTELVMRIAPTPEEASHYEALRRQAIAEADMAMENNTSGQARMNILAQLTRLRRAACDPRIVTEQYPVSGSKVQAFITLAVELVANGHKTLVFSQFVDFLDLLRQALDAAKLSYQYLDGATPAAERTKRVAQFQSGDSDLFLISLKAGGFGLNLTAADYVVITDPWWNPAAEDQAMGRAHRMGQKRPVTVYRLVTQGTVEEQIVSLHNDKRALADSILGEGDAVAAPSTDELMALIRGE